MFILLVYAPERSPASFSNGGDIWYGLTSRILKSYSAFFLNFALEIFLASFNACFV
jgi:hypothetical protein